MLQYVSLKAAIACSANEFTETFKLVFGVPRKSRDGDQGLVRIIPAAEVRHKEIRDIKIIKNRVLLSILRSPKTQIPYMASPHGSYK